ncbi:MAG: sugar phosphate isomerase/epimerase family protein [Luteitalea sp.]
MSNPSSRRSFLKQAGVASAAAAAASVSTASAIVAAPPPALLPPAPPGGSPKKAVLISMLPKALPFEERFALAREAGFAAVEMQTVDDPAEAERIAKASQAAKFPIHSVMNSEHWRSPLSSADPAVVDKSVKGMLTSIANAKLWGADTVLLVPAVVDAKTGYQDAWTRSTKVVRERLLPEAEKQGIIIGMEEVWNKFLLSPLEMNAYVDSFKSRYVQAYFDVGNVVFYAFPQDWIRTLGPRIKKVHLKDFKLDRSKGTFDFVHLGEGDIDWPEVRKALHEIGYDGFVTTEISGGDKAYLTDVVARIDRFLAGQPPVTAAAASAAPRD